MPLVHLIYVSSATRLLEGADLARILEGSAARNAASGITGMLLYADGSFMQALEGEAPDVQTVFARIERDPRHTGVIVLEHAPIATRSFARWSMGFRRLHAGDAAAHPEYAPLFAAGFDAERIGARPGVALGLLKQFAANQRV